ncbi:VanZ like family protein [Agromyces sp. CF514]|uniref:VanZ family protein n=1 Tax=Agromyces sp. CF514 TaxID=1881031 RepID=UPI0008E7E2BE|nr:VanZ family protein [Agromyces sp. CF514]SFR72256.1 VanZ like family protein [Agromyces sp. CF514]
MTRRASHRLRLGLAIAYGAALALVLFWPVHIDGAGGFVDFGPLLEAIALFGVPAWASYPYVEFAFNMALFVPLGLLVAVGSRRSGLQRVAIALAIGLVLSGLAEFAQHLLLASRTTDVRDVLANTLGAGLGAGIVVAIDYGLRRRETAIASAARTSAR